MKEKIDVLKNLIKDMDLYKITYSIGGSCMLFLRGIVREFNDIDLRVKEDDLSKLMDALNSHHTEKAIPNQKFKTHHFFEYLIDGVEIDIMVNLTICHEGIEYQFPLKQTDSLDRISLDGIDLVLDNLDEWLLYYELMERQDKVRIIKQYYKNKE
jgi:hypothetical protein